MKTSGKGNRPWNKIPHTIPMEGMEKSTRCIWSEDGSRCKTYVQSLPHHDFKRKNYCAKHREILAEREAEAMIAKDPKLIDYV